MLGGGPPSSIASIPNESKKMNPKKILIVDDQKDLCTALEKIIGQEGYEVSSVFNGKNAIAQIQKDPFDFVILDLKLPGLPGERVFSEIRRLRPKTKIVIMTGHGTIQSAAQMMQNGAIHYIQKPFDSRDLLNLLRKELGPGNEAQLEKELLQSIGTKVRTLREKEGLTIKDLAEKTDLSTSLISQVENGKISPSLSTLFWLSREFRIPLRQLF